MVRRVSISQFNSMVRQAQQKQRQAIDKYNREVRAYNQKVNQAINNYNREVRSHNARVRADRQRLRSEIQRLRVQNTTTRYVSFRTSVDVLNTAHEHLELMADRGILGPEYNDILDLSEREAANSASLMNALLDSAREQESNQPPDRESALAPLLKAISVELADRWAGALFSLSPRNPDAARHFCTSAREIVTQLLDAYAPDDKVTAAMPDCTRTKEGKPTRRAKFHFILSANGMAQAQLEEFIETDMGNILELFAIFNQGTHGSAGTYNLAQLNAIRIRVEDSILYILRVIRGH
jgi:signal transduction histidine kinase